MSKVHHFYRLEEPIL